MRFSDSLILIGLTGLAGAHPQKRSPNASPISKRAIDLEAFKLAPMAEYVSQEKLPEDASAKVVTKRADYTETAQDLVKATFPKAEFRMVKDHYVGSNGIAHVNFKQTVNGVDVDNADFNVNIGADGEVFSYGNSFYEGKMPGPLTKRDEKDPVEALKDTVSVLSLPVEADNAKAVKKSDKHYEFTGTSGTVSKPQAKLTYLVDDGKLKLTWRVETDIVDNWLLTYVNAAKTDEVVGVVDYNAEATYEVYPWGVNDPASGSRSVVKDPQNLAFSPFGWHSDGSSNYTTTRGNNGIAQTNPSGGSAYLNNYRPDSKSYTFEYKYSLTETNPTNYRDASTTQLFYTANQYHDVLHALGFDEKAGNFQANNNNNGGAANDAVILMTQDGSRLNNAAFSTPPDGQPGRMMMYIWDYSTPKRDSSFDTGVVIHEYTHGLSNRLTGGPANSGCLAGGESGGMGEGWSDFMAISVHLQPKDTRAAVKPMGDWIANEPKGIRAYPYATSLTTNPLTYKSANGLSSVHAIGTIWATALYEVLWNLIDKHGKNDEIFPKFNGQVPTDGKFLAMKLVMDGMALQPCGPNMVQARDAIIDADTALTGGKNKCELWKGFAKRGLGTAAKYSSSSRTESFALPSGC
ncbi:Fungalysin metallopeptidase-domain-containing protein [Fusarium flagelliforme]|uniref:Extracellular metalloproteinase n=1 Tax=Fusarium flagelliforme TaxID=2675880 RepID=A0A395N2P3_9HYPO|nr:Fungalysin metallopeptidase-domain-containing protein [Fusarium flagelliforme]KAH7174809.1 Fungalysin metallopeptidase-domain-containing protein [Fusarium flagelliforme]RFN54398.1 putative extracellular elastinolytic metalloproteinase precursor [Fusarium flagelliforme]